MPELYHFQTPRSLRIFSEGGVPSRAMLSEIIREGSASRLSWRDSSWEESVQVEAAAHLSQPIPSPLSDSASGSLSQPV